MDMASSPACSVDDGARAEGAPKAEGNVKAETKAEEVLRECVECKLAFGECGDWVWKKKPSEGSDGQIICASCNRLKKRISEIKN